MSAVMLAGGVPERIERSDLAACRVDFAALWRCMTKAGSSVSQGQFSSLPRETAHQELFPIFQAKDLAGCWLSMHYTERCRSQGKLRHELGCLKKLIQLTGNPELFRNDNCVSGK